MPMRSNRDLSLTLFGLGRRLGGGGKLLRGTFPDLGSHALQIVQGVSVQINWQQFAVSPELLFRL